MTQAGGLAIAFTLRWYNAGKHGSDVLNYPPAS